MLSGAVILGDPSSGRHGWSYGIPNRSERPVVQALDWVTECEQAGPGLWQVPTTQIDNRRGCVLDLINDDFLIEANWIG